MGTWQKAVAAFLAVGCLMLGGADVWAQGAAASDRSAMIDDVTRLLEQADAETAAQGPGPADGFLAPTPSLRIAVEDYARFLQTGIQPTGVAVRDDILRPDHLDPYYEGTFKVIQHVYLGRNIASYDKGVYAVPREAAYVGNFNYFPQDGSEYAPKGTFVMVGRRLLPDGSSETGIYIAENAIAGFALNFVRATPDYLKDFERRHAQAVAAYERQKQIELAEEEAAGQLFGQVLALGFSAAIIGSSDLPSFDKLQLGQAFVSDVLGEGDGTAMMSMITGMAGAAGGGLDDNLFAGGMNFNAPGLNGILQGAMGAAAGGSAPGIAGSGSGSSTARVASGGAAATPGALKQDRYSFSCPMGGSHTITVPYKTQACGAAAKNFARVYACNLIDDFSSAQRQCQQACGSPQCAE